MTAHEVANKGKAGKRQGAKRGGSCAKWRGVKRGMRNAFKAKAHEKAEERKLVPRKTQQ